MSPSPSADDRVGRMEFLLGLRRHGITDAAVLRAMDEVPREHFVSRENTDVAYADQALPIACGQTISQPYVVAYMTERLAVRPEHKVLEIGTGSGYQAAVLAEIARTVYTIELVPELAAQAEKTLTSLGYRNVHLRTGDGYAGWPAHAPFAKIIVTAAPEDVPERLVEQLAIGGTMILPVGPTGGDQELRVLTKSARGVATARSLPVRFVPMVKPGG